MPRPRLLISDLTGGEVSPRVQARADLERYGRAMKRCENFVVAQQGGVLLRRGSSYVGASMADLQTPTPPVAFITWRGSSAGEPDIMFELSGAVLRGFTNDGQIMAGAIPYQITVPVPNFAAAPVQFAQSGKTVALTNGVDAPLLLTVDGTASWTIAAIPSALYPSRVFADAVAPPRQDAINDVTFIGFAAGNSYHVYVAGKVIKERTDRRTGLPPRGLGGYIRSELLPRKFVYSTASTATNERRIKEAILLSSVAPDPAEVTVAFTAGTTYRITMSGDSGGIEVSLVATAESAAVRIEQATNASGRAGDELAWSYPTVVLHAGTYYRCLQAHASSAPTTPGAAPAYWEPLAGAPFYNWIQPSATWSVSSVSYAPGGRGFPSCCSFHDQRLILAGSRHAPKAIWGSAIGWFVNFVLGVEADEAWSVDLDAKDSPNIRWLLSYRGLVVGTSAGIWILTAEATLSPTDFQATRYSGDRAEALQAELAGNEVMFAAQGGRQLRGMRYNEQQGPYETIETSVLAEHLARYGIRQVAYAHQPQPVIYLRTAQQGLVVGITYNRQGELLAFYRLQFNAEILSIGVMFDQNHGDVLWMVVKRGTHVSIERVPYPITDAPVDVPSATSTVHLDGWRVRTHSAGVISGLDHLSGRTVTVMSNVGAVLTTAVVSQSAPASYTPLTVTDPGFELGGASWTCNIPSAYVVGPFSPHGGVNQATLTSTSTFIELSSANIAVTPGVRYRVRCWFKITPHWTASPILVVTVYNGVDPFFLQQITLNSTDPSITRTVGVWHQAELFFTADPTAAHITVGSQFLDIVGTSVLSLDDFTVDAETSATVDGTITYSGTNVTVGEAFLGKAVTVEPVTGNPAGPATGNPKRWANIYARLHQSALPKLNGERPSDYDQAGGAYRANPGALRSGDYKVNTDGWADGSITIEQDLPHATQVVGLFGDLGVGTGG